MDFWLSAGGVVLPSLDRCSEVYVVKPSNDFGPWTLPKGRVDPGETHEEAALREVKEEAGVIAGIIPGSDLGFWQGSCSQTRYYIMVARDFVNHDDETEEVKLLSFDEARELFKRVGNARDEKVLNAAEDWLIKHELLPKKQT